MWQVIGWIAASILGAAIWTIVVRQTPAIVTNLITSKIKHNYDEQIEQLKGAIAKESTAIQSAIGFLSATQPEVLNKAFRAVEALWTVIENQRIVYGDALFLLNILSPREFDRVLKDKNNTDKVRMMLNKYSNYESLHDTVKSAEEHLKKWEIIYVSARLWLTYQTLYQTQNRIAGLIHKMLEQGEYVDWRKDDLIIKAATALLSKEEFKRLTHTSRPDVLINSLRAQFIEEARRVVRGTNEWESVDEIFKRLMSLQNTDATVIRARKQPAQGERNNHSEEG